MSRGKKYIVEVTKDGISFGFMLNYPVEVLAGEQSSKVHNMYGFDKIVIEKNPNYNPMKDDPSKSTYP